MKQLFLICLFGYSLLFASNIQLIKKENPDSNTTLLVIGGIHGNEPGGYFAASLLATHYQITSKNLWIIPNLNQESILRNERGIHGDMNRKFSFIKPNDQDKKIVDEIKQIILSPNVSLVVNLHDGHGFYRKENKGSIFNPNAWGQTCVIDQCQLKQNQTFGNLNDIAVNVKKNINQRLLAKHHKFDVKNTKTKYEDEAMQLSLTYFAVTHNKPAFAIETSKNLSSLAQKVFYQLLAIEEYMKIMGIKYSRDFELNEKEITKVLRNYGTLSINGNFFLDLNNIKKILRFIPIKSKSNDFSFSHSLGKIKESKGVYEVYIGNNLVTKLKPQYFEICPKSPENFAVEIDGKLFSIKKASKFFVSDDFKVLSIKGYRVNVIGFSSKNTEDESNITIRKDDMNKFYSIDQDNRVYRIEFYKKDEFCAMILVQFK
ncbi:M99 family carboxypeptidase catalytic domain-containing protein [Sulfurimonas sp. C5]|uniref:M99 family carboxypeptidase catalytic domain-containing protein n=1 Tax=Sulfurimonas sp. C5 TaxID=3036947 RepID=UPI0024568AEA|nr:M99 family carboxypeptidase catalytic domain-containing protein [Sulfurimonas sp. C5]MDH4943551.1 M99 family carboxypeptidase catalytic domain-containing protein [Sulfurimonas sp. C5]